MGSSFWLPRCETIFEKSEKRQGREPGVRSVPGALQQPLERPLRRSEGQAGRRLAYSTVHTVGGPCSSRTCRTGGHVQIACALGAGIRRSKSTIPSSLP